MRTNNPFINFAVEIIVRMGKKSPKLFVYLQWVSAVVIAIPGLPAVLDKLFDVMGYVPPSFFVALENKTVAFCGMVGLFISLLPVEGDTVAVNNSGQSLKLSGGLPFTNQQDRKADGDHPIVPLQAPPKTK